MSNYYYLDISLILYGQTDYETTAVFFKKNLTAAVEQLFGEVASAIPVDILKFNPETKRGIVRVPKSHYVKFRSSLTLCGSYEGCTRCAYQIHKASPLLLALKADSRSYNH